MAGLLHRTCGNNFDAFDADARERFAFLAATARGCGGIANLAQNIVAFDELTEGGVVPVEKGGVAQTNKKLAAGGIGVLRAGHRDNTALRSEERRVGKESRNGGCAQHW